ncbi:hypothetical protein ACEPPN_004552 [Leptodophora sp. 'Broadleaf-Isolate-01']
MPRPRQPVTAPRTTRSAKTLAAQVTDLTRAPSPSAANQAKKDITSAIALWKANPLLYIQQEREKTLIRRADQKALATFESGNGLKATPTTFTKFLKLPYELRRMIWKLVAMEIRVVEIMLDTWTEKDARNCMLLSVTCVPAMLHVHHESREIGMKWYEQVTVCRRKSGVKVFGITFVKWDTDIVMFKTEGSLEKFLSNQADFSNARSSVIMSCRKLAVTHWHFHTLRQGICGNLRFETIEELIITRANNKSDNQSTARLVLSKPPHWGPSLAKLVDRFNVVMDGHTTPKSTVVMIARRLEHEPKFLEQERQEKRDRQYDSDLLVAARLQEELDRRG